MYGDDCASDVSAVNQMYAALRCVRLGLGCVLKYIRSRLDGKGEGTTRFNGEGKPGRGQA